MSTGSLRQTNGMEVIGVSIPIGPKPNGPKPNGRKPNGPKAGERKPIVHETIVPETIVPEPIVPKPIVPEPNVPKAIYWIRHAESCANLLENKIVDTYLDEDKANQHSELFARHAVKSRYFDDAGNVKKSDDSYPDNIGSILKSISLQNFTRDKSDFSKPIFTGADSRWLFHPPLSSVGIQQAKKLSTRDEFKAVVKECTVFITSATVRTIMTAIYSLNRIKNVTLYVVPYINEKMNEASEFGLDFVNTGIPKDKIDEIIQCVIKYVTSAVPVKTEMEHQFKVGTITIDTGFYHSVEPLPETETEDQEDVLIKNIATFKTSIIPQLCEYMKTNTQEMTILAYSHGYVINNLLKSHGSEYPEKVKYAPNVSMFKEDYTANTMEVVEVDKENAPNGGVFVRKGATEIITDDDDYDTPNNMSPCSLYGLRGEVNEILFGYQHQQLTNEQRNTLQSMDYESMIKYGGGSRRKYKKYRTRRNLSKYRKQTKRPRRTSRIRKNRRSLKK